MHFHHVVSLLLLTWPLFTGLNGAECVETIIQAEITNPCLNGIEILPYFGNGSPQLIFVLQLVFLVTFMCVRVFWSTASLAKVQLSNSLFAFKVIPTFIWILSMKWVWMMINKAIKISYEVSTLQWLLI